MFLKRFDWLLETSAPLYGVTIDKTRELVTVSKSFFRPGGCTRMLYLLSLFTTENKRFVWNKFYARTRYISQHLKYFELLILFLVRQLFLTWKYSSCIALPPQQNFAWTWTHNFSFLFLWFLYSRECNWPMKNKATHAWDAVKFIGHDVKSVRGNI